MPKKYNAFIYNSETCKIVVKRKNGEVYLVLIDTEDLLKVRKYSWYVRVFKNGYTQAVSKIAGKTIYMHRLLGSPKEDLLIDHINRHPLDNRKANLREATKSQNAQNLNGARVDNKSSGHRGVSWSKERQKWETYCNVNGKRHRMGRFDSLEEAILAVVHARAILQPFSIEGMAQQEALCTTS